MNSRDSAAVANMSEFGTSSSQGSAPAKGRPKVSPKYPISTLARCLTRPSRLVPVGTSGRRTSYSDKPSSFHSTAPRMSCR
jgi:hypothetical protein